MNGRLVLVLILAVLVVLFIIQNIVAVKIQFLFWSIEMSRSLMIILLLLVGISIGWFLHGYMSHKKRS